MMINTLGVKLNMNWHNMSTHTHTYTQKYSEGIFLYTVERDSCYLIPVISKDKGSQIYECVHIHACVCVCISVCP